MTSDTSHPKAEAKEAELARQLASFDEALRGGAIPVSELTPPEVEPTLRVDLERAQDCLRLLEEVWPRHPSNAPSLVQPVMAAWAALAASDATLPPTIGRFQIQRELGRGGFGIVYLAHDPQLKRDVALKVPRADILLSPELRQRFRQEARAAAGLDHPNLVPVYETGEIDSLCYIVSAYCPGVNLADWLRRETEPVAYRDAARLVQHLAEGVQHAHKRGILHRDLKPANVLLTFGREAGDNGHAEPGAHSRLNEVIPKITDFGLAKLMDANVQTQTQAAIGTPSYMAPEQAVLNGPPASPATDVYSLGVILYELLAGRPPFLADSPLEI